MELYQIITYLFRDAVAGTDYFLQDNGDGNGPFISVWLYSKAPQPTAEQLAAAEPAAAAWYALQDLKTQARAAFRPSDITVLRCVEHGIAVPQEWVDYRAALRQIVSAPDDAVFVGMPVKPPYPSGS